MTIVYTGDVGGTQEIEATDNTSSPAAITFQDLASGANTITVPTGATACTILPPADNTTSITLKKVTGDTGIRLHNTGYTDLSLDSSVTTFCLTAGASITGIRLFWS